MNEDVVELVQTLEARVAAETGEAPFLTAIPNYMLHRRAVSTIHALVAENERLRDLADKYKWQVRDTCTRAERAEAKLHEAVEVIEFYSAEDNYCAGGLIERHTAGSDDISFDELEQPPVLADEGTRARAFLATMEKPNDP